MLGRSFWRHGFSLSFMFFLWKINVLSLHITFILETGKQERGREVSIGEHGVCE